MLREAKVGHFEVTKLIQQKVFGLEVSVDVIGAVHVLEGKDDVGRVELGGGVVEASCPPEVGEKFLRFCCWKRQRKGNCKRATPN